MSKPINAGGKIAVAPLNFRKALNNLRTPRDVLGLSIHAQTIIPCASHAINMNAGAVRAKKIMVVDDNEIILKTISFKLQEAGYTPFAVLDGVEAVAVARRETLDLILLDINFPPDVYGEPWDGFRILEWLRHVDQVRHVPVIIISGSEAVADKERAEKNGVTAFFRKPIDHVDLLKVIREVLETAGVPAIGIIPAGGQISTPAVGPQARPE